MHAVGFHWANMVPIIWPEALDYAKYVVSVTHCQFDPALMAHISYCL